MEVAGGQLCARARFWVSLRIDGELSELEGALLDAHLACCADCRAVAAGFTDTTEILRCAPLERVPPVAVSLGRSPRRLLVGFVAAAVVVAGAVAGGIVRGEVASAPQAPHAVAVVASLETPDQLRRLRRTTLLNQRQMPHETAGEPV